MASKKKSVEKNYIYNLTYQMLTVVIPVIITPYISRVLNADGIGIFSYTTAVVGYFVLLGNLGIATYGQLQVAKYQENRFKLSKIFFELLILRAILLLLILLIYLVFIQFQDMIYRSIYYVLIIQILCSLLDISWFLQGLEEFKSIVMRNTLIKVLSVISILIFVKKDTDLILYAFIMNASTLLGNISIFAYVPKYVQRVKLTEINLFKHISNCLVYFIPTVATTIYLTLDKTMIGWFSLNTLENGYYEQAQKIELMVVTIVTSLSVVTMPRMTYLLNNNQFQEFKVRLEQSIRFILFLSLPMTLGLVGIANNFIPLFLGVGFEKSISILKIFSLLVIIIGLNNALGKQILMPSGQQRAYNISVVIGAVINIVFNLILIPQFFSLGAAISSVLAEFAILIIFLYYSRNYIPPKWVIRTAVKYLGSSIVMFLIIRAIEILFPPSWTVVIIQVIVGVAVYILLLYILKDQFVRKYYLRFRKLNILARKV